LDIIFGGLFVFEIERELSIEGVEVFKIFSKKSGISYSFLKNIGITINSIEFKSREFIYFPYSISDYQNSQDLAGIPLLYPFANRLSYNGFSFQNSTVVFDKIPFRDQLNLPLHGFLLKNEDWSMLEPKISGTECLIKFFINWKEDFPFYKLFPFKHYLEISYILTHHSLIIKLKIKNLDNKHIPISFGFHPYFNLLYVGRNKSYIKLSAKNKILTDEKLIPTGTYEPIHQIDPIYLKSADLDTGFTDLFFNDLEYSETVLIGNDFSVKMNLSKSYPIVLIYSPIEKDYICIEPMTSITDGINLYGKGNFKNLKILEIDGEFDSEFQIIPEIF
jgi:aldose 1-epimerase